MKKTNIFFSLSGAKRRYLAKFKRPQEESAVSGLFCLAN